MTFPSVLRSPNVWVERARLRTFGPCTGPTMPGVLAVRAARYQTFWMSWSENSPNIFVVQRYVSFWSCCAFSQVCFQVFLSSFRSFVRAISCYNPYLAHTHNIHPAAACLPQFPGVSVYAHRASWGRLSHSGARRTSVKMTTVSLYLNNSLIWW